MKFLVRFNVLQVNVALGTVNEFVSLISVISITRSCETKVKRSIRAENAAIGRIHQIWKDF